MDLKKKRALKGFMILSLSALLSPGNTFGQTFNQTNDENGLVVFEAENFTDQRTATDGSSWEIVAEPADYSGTGAMKATHADGATFTAHKTMTEAQTSAPVLKYNVKFVKTDSVYVWARASHVDGFDDSVWPGLDGSIVGTSGQSLTYLTTEQSQTDFYYINHGMDGNRFVMGADTNGVKVFEMYYRETNFIFDKIILTTNPDYDPNTVSPSSLEETGSNFRNTEVYPNPSCSGIVNVSFNAKISSTASVSIYDLSGRLHGEIMNFHAIQGNNSIAISTQKFNTGIYLLKLQIDNNTEFIKLVIK